MIKLIDRSIESSFTHISAFSGYRGNDDSFLRSFKLMYRIGGSSSSLLVVVAVVVLIIVKVIAIIITRIKIVSDSSTKK